MMESVVGNQRARAQLFHKIGSLTLSYSPPASNGRRPPILVPLHSKILVRIQPEIAITYVPLKIAPDIG